MDNNDLTVKILAWILTINVGSLVAILSYGYKIVSFFNELKFKTNILWQEHEERQRRLRELEDRE